MMQRRRQTSKPRILVVDDQETQRLLASETLKQGGFDVLEAKSGKEALALLATNDIAAMVVDVMMPDMNGFELCKRVRAEPRGRYMPIMMMTARNDEIAIEQAYDAGATDFSVKPTNPLVFNKRMQYMLRGASTMEQLRRNDNLFGIAEEVGQSGSWEWSAGSGAIRCTAGFLKLFGIPADASWSLDLFRKCITAPVADRIEKLAVVVDDTELPLTLSHEGAAADGALRHFETRVDRREDLLGQKVICCVTQDVTQRRAAEQEIRELAYIDKVTGLPNRVLFSAHLKQILKSAKRNNHRFALLHVDVDDFKRINKLADRKTGDEILARIAGRILDTLRECDVVTRSSAEAPDNAKLPKSEPFARLGGDEFVIVLGDICDPAGVQSVCDRILASMRKPFTVDGRSFQLSACIGVALYPDHGTDVEGLLLSVDTAVSEAKKQGKSRTQTYSSDIHDQIMERLSITNELRTALDNGELDVFYQPRVDIHRRQVVGMEALVRWSHNGKAISPGQFIPLAEESELIHGLGEFVMRRACTQLAMMREEGLPDLELGINVSAKQLEDPGLVSAFSKILSECGIPPQLLCLELTESALMQHADQNVELLQTFRKLGCKVAIDDFGTGYSSLNYLKRFPIDTLKIDRSFVVDLASNNDDGTIVTAVVRLAQTLGLTVVAEGVETAGQEAILKRLGCDEIQGYIYSRPLPYAEFVAWLRDRVSVSTVLRVTQ